MARRSRSDDADRPLLVDDSSSLLNRTGVHYLTQDLLDHLRERLGPGLLVRRWRRTARPLPTGLRRRILGRLMVLELRALGSRSFGLWPNGSARRRVFLDPLYTLRSRLDSGDIVTCHDLGPLTHPELYAPWIRRAYGRAYERIAHARPTIVFVSAATRDVFESIWGDDFAGLITVPLYARAATSSGEVSPVRDVGGDFLLSVGALEHRKNHVAAIEAYGNSGLAERGIELVICGPRGDAAAAVAQAAASTPGVRLLGYVSDAELRWLYHHARAFVLLSHLEGFGMPALEAASHGLVPVISRDTALASIVGDLGMQVDADDRVSIVAGLQTAAMLTAEERAARAPRLRAQAATMTRERFFDSWTELLSR